MFLSLHVLPKKLPATQPGRSLDVLFLRCLVTCVHDETWSDAQTPLKRTKSHICCQTQSHFSCLYKEANLTIIVCAFVRRRGCVKRKEVLETVGSVWVGPDAKLKYLACVWCLQKKKNKINPKNSPKLFYYSTDFYISRTFLKESPQLFSSPLFFSAPILLYLFFLLYLCLLFPRNQPRT